MNRTSLWIVALLGMLLGFSEPLHAYVLYSDKWPSGSHVTMQLELGSFSGTLIDGTVGGWGPIAESALTEWNTKINLMQFGAARNSTASIAGNNSLNNVYWGTTIYGQAFGSRTLAYTTFWFVGTRRTEADVVFNTAKPWNSYRGALKTASSGGTLFDFRRVALHEFGHVVGLNHPDEAGQNVVAQMNANTSNLDDLAADDIAGAQALYGAPVIVIPTAGITAPLPGSTLSSINVTFGWNRVSGSVGYWLYVGSALGKSDYFNSNNLASTVSSKWVTGLPSDGRKLYVRIYTNHQGTWYHTDTTFTSLRSVSALMLHPLPGSTVTKPISFQWRGGIGATAYRLSVGTALGKANLYNSKTLSATTRSLIVNPTRTAVIYVRLWSLVSGIWYQRDYSYRM